jgi:hypothetical protein
MCGWKIHVICYTSYFSSLVLALLPNTSYSFTLLRIIAWSLQYLINFFIAAHLKMAAGEVQRFFVFTAGLRSFQIDEYFQI